jgi:hypothetical protein
MQGNKHNPLSKGFISMGVVGQTSDISVSCTPVSTVAKSATTITCIAEVTDTAGYPATGNVTWVQTGTGWANFGTTSFVLVSGNCQVTLTGAVAGRVNVVAAYQGSGFLRGVSGYSRVTVS